MKIKKIKFIRYKHFKINHEIDLEKNGSIPYMTFLVGDNGSGKTAVLDAVFGLYNYDSIKGEFQIEYYLELSPDEMLLAHRANNEITVHISRIASGGLNLQIEDTLTMGRINNFPLDEIKKAIFSTVETNFSEAKFTTVTAKTIDNDSLPKEKSTNLSTEIPQLLIDIKNADSQELADYFRANPTKTYRNKANNIGVRMDRFTTAFHEMYDGTKTFKEIKDGEGTKNIIFTDQHGRDVSIHQMSTGEKQIIYRIGYLLKNLGTIKGGVILIDEPEISLHPVWQARIKNIIKKTFQGLDVQFIIATHSPYIFQEFDEGDEACLKVDSNGDKSISIALGTTKPELQKSTDYISYVAYGVPSSALHTELYTLLQIQEKKESIKKRETWLKDPAKGNVLVTKTFTATMSYSDVSIGDSVTETLPTYIRNLCNHGNETARTRVSGELKKSIDIMLSLLR